MLKETYVRFNNWRTRRKRGRLSREDLLVMLPSCLQRSSCDINLRKTVEQCQRCGQCNVGPIVEMCQELGVPLAMATGGRQAAARVREPQVKAVVAVACVKELVEGIRATFPKAVIAVENRRPHGPCIDTCVDVDEVRRAIEFFLKT